MINKVKIAVDAMGGENSPKKVIFNSGMGALIRTIDTMCNRKSNEISRNKRNCKSFPRRISFIQTHATDCNVRSI